MPVQIPQVSEAELHSFHETHFSASAVDIFHHQFYKPDPQQVEASHEFQKQDEELFEDEDYDDGLGYYPDGVKRTLTDEQIAIFRHSEIEALRRAKAAQQKPTFRPPATASTTTMDDSIARPSSSSTSCEITNHSASLERIRNAANHKKSKNKNNKQRRREPKPDLRKRTWDVVEPGLECLEYD